MATDDRADGATLDNSDADGDFDTLLGKLWSVLEHGEDLAGVLQRLADIAIGMFPKGYEASIMILARGDEPETIAATDRDVLPLDRAQYESGSGPSLDAAKGRTPVRTDLEGARERWPEFAAGAEMLGVHGYLSAPLANGDTVIGSFNLYSRTAEKFDAVDAALLTMFTNSALAAVGNAERHRTARALAEQLRTALESRSAIDQAVGVLMHRHGLTAEKAWDALTRESQNRNIKVRDLAFQITRSGPSARPATGETAAD